MLLLVSLAACGSQPTPTVTATPTPTDTPSPTFTFTPTATDTPVPTNTPKPADTPTPTIEPTLALEDARLVGEGGFSFRPPTGYDVDIQGAQVGVFDKAGTIIISIYGATSNPQNKTPEEIADEFLAGVFKKGEGEYQKGISYPVTVDGVEGLAYDLTGTLFGSPVRGQAIIIMPNDQQYLFGLGVANTGQDKNRWENEGDKTFTALMDSITFSTSSRGATGDCVIATDSTYGYTMENPIKVGGDAFDGPPRERAYLDNLLGPNGEQITYVRTGSTPFEETILDVFEISGLGQTITLYIDEYAYTEPQAPSGLTCVVAFPLSRP